MDLPTADRFPYQAGTTVVARDGTVVGTILEVVADPASGAPSALLVEEEDGTRVRVEADAVDTAASGPDAVRLNVDRTAFVAFRGATGAERGHYDAVDRLVVPLHEEVLVPERREVDLGQVVLQRSVETVPYQGEVEVGRDEVSVERVTVNRPITAVPAPRQEGDTLVYPVVEEVLVTEKRLMLREEIRITRRRVTEPVPIRSELRREVVEVVDTPDAPAAQRVGGTGAVVDEPGSPSAKTDAATPGELPLT